MDFFTEYMLQYYMVCIWLNLQVQKHRCKGLALVDQCPEISSCSGVSCIFNKQYLPALRVGFIEKVGIRRHNVKIYSLLV